MTATPIGSSAASMVLALANCDTIDPDAAAQVLELRLVHVEYVTAYRREYQLGGNPLWTDATAIVGGRDGNWRAIDLVPRELSLAALRLDPPHEIRPQLKHTSDGPVVVALEQAYRTRSGMLVIRTTGTSQRIERITFTTDRSPA